MEVIKVFESGRTITDEDMKNILKWFVGLEMVDSFMDNSDDPRVHIIGSKEKRWYAKVTQQLKNDLVGGKVPQMQAFSPADIEELGHLLHNYTISFHLELLYKEDVIKSQIDKLVRAILDKDTDLLQDDLHFRRQYVDIHDRRMSEQIQHERCKHLILEQEEFYFIFGDEESWPDWI